MSHFFGVKRAPFANCEQKEYYMGKRIPDHTCSQTAFLARWISLLASAPFFAPAPKSLAIP
jgi:hypothetical protein